MNVFEVLPGVIPGFILGVFVMLCIMSMREKSDDD